MLKDESDSGNETCSPVTSNGNKCREKSWIWRENMVEVLISFWESEELLYNINHPDYHNKEKRKDAVERISVKLGEYGFNPAPPGNAITEKINSLRIYYVAQRNKLEHSKMSGASDVEQFKIKWRYFESLSFLNDNVTPRYNHYNLKRRLEKNEYDYSDYGKQDIPSSFCEPRLHANSRRMDEPIESPPPSNNSYEIKFGPPMTMEDEQVSHPLPPSSKSADMLFAEMVGKLLQNIPNGAAKDMLKIDIQKMIFQTQYGTHRPLFSDNR